MKQILLIPDVHCRPGSDLSYLRHIGQLAVEKKPDIILQIGDFADMPSLSSYDVGKKSFEGRRYISDVASAIEGMDYLLGPIKEYNHKFLESVGAPRIPKDHADVSAELKGDWLSYREASVIIESSERSVLRWADLYRDFLILRKNVRRANEISADSLDVLRAVKRMLGKGRLASGIYAALLEEGFERPGLDYPKVDYQDDEPAKEPKELPAGCYNPRKIMTLGNHCLSPDTQVYIKDKGWIDYTDVKVGDLVVSFGDDNTKVYAEVGEVIELDYSGDMYESDTTASSLKVTPDHRIYYTTSNGVLKCKLAKDFGCEFDLVSSVSTSTTTHMSDANIKLAAWLCTDSCFSAGGVTLYQRESNAHKVQSILDGAEVKYSKTIRDRRITHVCGKLLKKPCEKSVDFRLSAEESRNVSCNTGVYSNKRLPKWVMECDNRQWDLFLDELIEADGSIPTGATTSRVFFGRLEICEDVQVCAQMHGWRASITEYRPGQYRVNLAKTSKVRTALTKVKYEGKVWCLHVPETGNFMVRRHNKIHFTGNCNRINRVINDDPKLDGTIGIGDLKYREAGWEVYPFLEVVDVEGIMFSHYFTSGVMGRPVASARSLLQKKHASCVMGHVQHRDIAYSYTADGRELVGLFCGTAYNDHHEYLGAQGQNHFRGVWILKNVEDGTFEPVAYTLDELERRYSV